MCKNKILNSHGQKFWNSHRQNFESSADEMPQSPSDEIWQECHGQHLTKIWWTKFDKIHAGKIYKNFADKTNKDPSGQISLYILWIKI